MNFKYGKWQIYINVYYFSEITVTEYADVCKKQSLEVGQKVFQSALKASSVTSSTPNTPFRTHDNEFTGLLHHSTRLTDTNAISKTNPKISRIMSENNMIRNVFNENQSEGSQSIELRRLYYKKSETSNIESKGIDKITSRNKYSFGYSTNDLVTFDTDRPILSQRSYEALSKSQAELFRFTAV